jgi:predicted  nucleic acid-binding Zn-ribbon protein
MEETPKDFDKLSVRELKEDLEKAEVRMKDLNEAAELAFKVIREKENALLNEISTLREEIKKRGTRDLRG